MKLRPLQSLKTAEGIALNIELCGVPARLIAFLIDLWASAGVLLFLCTGLAIGLSTAEKTLARYFFQYDWRWLSTELVGVAISLLMLGFFFSYFFFQEWLWNGKTMGKSLMKIRVVRNNGQPIGFWESFGRNSLRLVDVMISGLGVIFMLFSPSQKRLGDYLAGSLVINDASDAKQHAWIRESLTGAPNKASAQTTPSRLSVDEKALLDAFKARQRNFCESGRAQLDLLLRQYFADKLGVSKAEASDVGFLYRLD